MLSTNLKQLIETNPEIFEDWGCKIICVKLPCFCEINDPVPRCVC